MHINVEHRILLYEERNLTKTGVISAAFGSPLYLISDFSICKFILIRQNIVT